MQKKQRNAKNETNKKTYLKNRSKQLSWHNKDHMPTKKRKTEVQGFNQKIKIKIFFKKAKKITKKKTQKTVQKPIVYFKKKKRKYASHKD